MSVSYRLEDGIAVITIDDGKVNVLSEQTLSAIGAALDRAEADRAVVVLEGREGIFSAGFDLPVLRAGGPAATAMVRAGFELAMRILAHPLPVVVACTGHAIAMGLFLLQSGDLRLGAAGPYRFAANEVALGVPVPYAAIEILRQRMAPAALHVAVTLAASFDPRQALDVGLLDRVVDAAELPGAAREAARSLLALDLDAHAETKRRVRAGGLAAVRAGFAADETARATRASEAGTTVETPDPTATPARA